jgi:hypothetical protein
MDMRKLLEAVSKFAGEPEQKPGDQVKGTDAAKKSSKEHPFKGKLVGDSKDNMLRGLSQVAEDKSLEWELAEAYAKFMEDDLGVEPKRPARKGSRHARGHEPKLGYTTVKEATREEEWQGWKIRYETAPQIKGQPLRWMVWHTKRGTEAAHEGSAATPQEAVQAAKEWIQSGGNAKDITTASTVTIDFNVKFASDIVNGNDFYATIVSGPTLLVSSDAKPGFKRSHIRTQQSKATQNTTLLPVIALSSNEAKAAGLKAHGRYILGDTQQLEDGTLSYPLIYQSTVQAKGDMMRLGKPGLTVAMNREVSGLEEGWESGPEEPSSRGERDPDDAYDDMRQQRADAEAERQQARRPQEQYYTLTGRGPNMEPNYAFPGEYATQDEAAAARSRLMADPKTPNPRDIGISKHTRYLDLKEGIESGDPVESAVLNAVQELIQQGHTEVAPEVITNMVVAATSQPFLLKDLVDVNNNSQAVQHYVDSINPTKVKFSNEILTVKNEDPMKDKQAAQNGVAKMAAKAAGRSRLGEASTPLRDREDYDAKSKALQDIQIDPSTSQDPELTAEIARRKAELVQQAKSLGISESRAHKIIANKLKQIQLRQQLSTPADDLAAREARAKEDYRKYVEKMKEKNPNYIPLYKMDEAGSAVGSGAVGNGASSVGTAALNPDTVKQTTAALNTFKAATGSNASTPNIAKALDAVTQGNAVGGSEMKILEPVMKDLATVATDPKLAGQFKSLAGQVNQTQQKQQQAK